MPEATKPSTRSTPQRPDSHDFMMADNLNDLADMAEFSAAAIADIDVAFLTPGVRNGLSSVLDQVAARIRDVVAELVVTPVTPFGTSPELTEPRSFDDAASAREHAQARSDFVRQAREAGSKRRAG